MARKAEALARQPELLNGIARNVSDNPDATLTLLARHLRRYTRKNTSDFFIHKDLGGFLRRELDYYLKAEVLKLDALLAGGERPAEAWLPRLGILREIGEAERRNGARTAVPWRGIRDWQDADFAAESLDPAFKARMFAAVN